MMREEEEGKKSRLMKFFDERKIFGELRRIFCKHKEILSTK
jgi:hypothetical protein